jgi:hypothetical protein
MPRPAASKFLARHAGIGVVDVMRITLAGPIECYRSNARPRCDGARRNAPSGKIGIATEGQDVWLS